MQGKSWNIIDVNVINKEKQFSNVFVYAASIVGFLVVIGAILPKQFGEITGMMSAWVSTTFGWYYMLFSCWRSEVMSYWFRCPIEHKTNTHTCTK